MTIEKPLPSNTDTNEIEPIKPQFVGECKSVGLVDVCEILDSKRIPITKYKRIAGPYPYYGANGIQDYVANYLFDDELVLLAEDGGHFEKSGQIAYRISGKCWVNNHAHVLKAKDNINIDYLCYALQSLDVSSLVNGATRKKLTQSAMKKISLPLRSIDSQLAIVNKLKSTEMQLENAHKLLSTLDKLVKSRFIEMFEHDRFPTAPIGKIALSKMPNARKAFDTTDSIRYIDISSIDSISCEVTRTTEYLLENAPSRAQQCVSKGDLLVSTVRPNLKNVATITLNDENLVASTGFCVLRCSECPPEYLKTIVRSEKFTHDMCQLTTGANYPAIKNSDILNYEIPLPPKEDMNQFAAFVRQVDKLRFKTQQQIEKLEMLKESLMQEYFG